MRLLGGRLIEPPGSAMAQREEEDYPDELEERLVNEEYKIWKKNTPFLYGGRPPMSRLLCLTWDASPVSGNSGC